MIDLTIECVGASLAASYSPGEGTDVVLLHGASMGTRNYPLYQHLHEILPRVGVGVVSFDRRGEGESTGNPSRGNFELQKSDALAVVEALGARRTGIWGFSQGAWIAPLVATASTRIEFLIGVAATGVTPHEQMIYGVAEHLRRSGYDEATISLAIGLRRKFAQQIHSGEGTEQLVVELAKASCEPWWEHVYLPDRPLSELERSDWISEMDFDPAPSFAATQIPVLAFYGEHDEWTPVDLSVAAWRAARGEDVTIEVISGVGHDLTDSSGAISKRYEESMLRWIGELKLGNTNT